ncbi:MAG: Coq4 family protein [Cyanobacteria bacterium J06638_7]
MLLNLKQRLQSLRMVAGLAQFLQNPDSLDSVFAVARGLQNSPLSAQMFRHLLADPALAELVRQGWRPPAIDLDALDQLPPGSLGRVYAQQLRSQGLSPESLIDPSPITSPEQFVVHRLRETHDIVHVLTGFGTDGAGELGLQAFNLAQNRSPLAAMLIFGGILKALQEDEPLEPLLRSLARGFELGLRSPCLIAQKLEEGWQRPLSDWQDQLGLPLEQPALG